MPILCHDLPCLEVRLYCGLQRIWSFMFRILPWGCRSPSSKSACADCNAWRFEAFGTGNTSLTSSSHRWAGILYTMSPIRLESWRWLHIRAVSTYGTCLRDMSGQIRSPNCGSEVTLCDEPTRRFIQAPIQTPVSNTLSIQLNRILRRAILICDIHTNSCIMKVCMEALSHKCSALFAVMKYINGHEDAVVLGVSWHGHDLHRWQS